MFQAAIDLVKASRPLQFALVFVAGGIVAALFYPTKQIKETMQQTFQSQISTLNQQHSKELETQQESFQKQTEELTQTNKQLTSKVSELTTQVTNLKSHQQKAYSKITHPDGTIEVKYSSEKDSAEQSESSTERQTEIDQAVSQNTTKLTQQFQQQMDSKQQEWDSKEKSYQTQISTLTQSKSVTINPKNFTLDVGGLTSGDYYGHVTYDVWGPFIIGLQAEFGASSAAGAGIGLRF
jgi:hypothetical protein